METETAAASLPDDLLAGVLGRLRARSHAASCGVCKAWRDLIDERQLLVRFRRLLPHSVRGHQLAGLLQVPLVRPTGTTSPEYDGSCRIDGKFNFIQRERAHTLV
jgi:hypothetical protein